MTVHIIKLLPVLLLLLVQLTSYAQIGINSNNATPDPSAILDVSSTTSGFLTPRMTQTERDAISNPATSLLIYQTDNTPGYYYNSGTPATPNWVRIGNDENTVVCGSRTPIDSVAHFSTYDGRTTAYLITAPGSYYLTDSIVISETNTTAIFIDSDNVTLDLNGYCIKGPGVQSVSDGIFVEGDKYNITIKNGMIDGWGSMGIDARQSNNCLFQNIAISNSENRGFYLGNHSVIIECHAYNSKWDGFNGIEGCNFIRCTARENGADGFEAFAGSQFINCTASYNGTIGIYGGDEVFILGCVAYINDGEGIYGGDNSFVHKCHTYLNWGSGIEVNSSSRVSACHTTDNRKDGIRLVGLEGIVSGCMAINNEKRGIHSTTSEESRILIKGNSVIDSFVDGIEIDGPGAFVISNRVAGSVGDDYNLHPDTNHGPIIDVVNLGDISTISGADHPYANFSY